MSFKYPFQYEYGPSPGMLSLENDLYDYKLLEAKFNPANLQFANVDAGMSQIIQPKKEGYRTTRYDPYSVAGIAEDKRDNSIRRHIEDYFLEKQISAQLDKPQARPTSQEGFQAGCNCKPGIMSNPVYMFLFLLISMIILQYMQVQQLSKTVSELSGRFSQTSSH